jgi:hypothetical protein
MSYLIGGGDFYSSHNFRLLRYGDFDRYVRKNLNEKIYYPIPDERILGDSVVDTEDDLEGETSNSKTSESVLNKSAHEQTASEINNQNDSMEDENTSFPASQTEEVLLHVERGSVKCSDEVQDYVLRGKEDPFDTLTIWNYVAKVTKFPKRTEDSQLKHIDGDNDNHMFHPLSVHTGHSQRKGKHALPRGTFLTTHGQTGTHISRIKEIDYVPVILGPKLPRPDRGEEEYQHWC